MQPSRQMESSSTSRAVRPTRPSGALPSAAAVRNSHLEHPGRSLARIGLLVLHGISIVDQHADLLFYALKDGHVSTVFHHPEFLSDWSVALAPDGREILWVQIDARFADLMRVQNFR